MAQSEKIKNILFIMADQLRWDYLSCYGHPYLHTPNMDALAERGVRFDRAYVQSPVCGPSRASFYTGRTVFSHGATWNRVPLPIGEMTLGDYLAPIGVRTGLVGKTHFVPDHEGMARLGLNASTEIGLMVQQGGFEPFERDDGLHPTGLLQARGGQLRYNDWLREKGYISENPWNDFANAAEGPNGEILSAWDLRHSHLPARVAEEHSETAYMTMRAKEFIEDAGDTPWLCHLSYIKPHWPYMAPAPYHNMYGPDSFLPIHRAQAELAENANPVFRAFADQRVSKTFSEDGVRETVLPAYMGMIKQIDDHLGRLFSWMEERDLMKDTMIVMTSDHGDYLGDHWLGEKELFHECSVRVPLIICDPRAAADETRGTVNDDFVEAIDLVPTFLEATGAPPVPHRLEGRSLMGLLNGQRLEDWRDYVFSEIDYGIYHARETLGVGVADARGYMIRDERWKFIYFRHFPPQLFDLENDPEEFIDLGQSADHAAICQHYQDILMDKLTSRRNRIAMDDTQFMGLRAAEDSLGIKIGFW